MVYMRVTCAADVERASYNDLLDNLDDFPEVKAKYNRRNCSTSLKDLYLEYFREKDQENRQVSQFMPNVQSSVFRNVRRDENGDIIGTALTKDGRLISGRQHTHPDGRKETRIVENPADNVARIFYEMGGGPAPFQ